MRIREAQPGDAGPIARVHLDAWRTTYADFLPADFLAGLSYQDREATWVDTLATHRPRTCNFVAETNEGEIVGFACGGPEEEGDQIYPGELYLVYLFHGITNEKDWAGCLLRPWRNGYWRTVSNP